MDGSVCVQFIHLRNLGMNSEYEIIAVDCLLYSGCMVQFSSNSQMIDVIIMITMIMQIFSLHGIIQKRRLRWRAGGGFSLCLPFFFFLPLDLKLFPEKRFTHQRHTMKDSSIMVIIIAIMMMVFNVNCDFQ